MDIKGSVSHEVLKNEHPLLFESLEYDSMKWPLWLVFSKNKKHEFNTKVNHALTQSLGITQN